MHEISLCQNLREIIEDQARTQKFSKVTRIWLEVGPFSCVEPEALRFGFDTVMRDSIVQDASLEISSSPATAQCLACGANATVDNRLEPCPECGLPGLQISGGDALKISRMEVV